MRRAVGQSGFTLVEMIVTISIFMLTVAVALPNATRTASRQQLSGAAQQVQTAIYQAKSLALAPLIDKDPVNDSYAFHLSSKTTYEVIELNSQDPLGSSRRTIRSDVLPKGVSLTVENEPIVFDETIDFSTFLFSISAQGKIISPDPLLFSDGVIILAVTNANGVSHLNLSTVTGQVEIE